MAGLREALMKEEQYAPRFWVLEIGEGRYVLGAEELNSSGGLINGQRFLL